MKANDPTYIPPYTPVGRRIYNERTAQQVRSFQDVQGLTVDGIVQQGDQGPAVMAVQSQLRVRGLLGVPIDGQFTADIDAKVRDFQNNHSLPITGGVDPQTWQVLLAPA